ncbi:hypothetical protein F5Y18DRAFT_422214 [Xylariaceae sp. FL1019]|nr:hypothetical protein F5Y18DRAFT_422214 [Xylariaceae sp. FL1019]
MIVSCSLVIALSLFSPPPSLVLLARRIASLDHNLFSWPVDDGRFGSGPPEEFMTVRRRTRPLPALLADAPLAAYGPILGRSRPCCRYDRLLAPTCWRLPAAPKSSALLALQQRHSQLAPRHTVDPRVIKWHAATLAIRLPPLYGLSFEADLLDEDDDLTGP